MAVDNELRQVVHELAVAAREGFEYTHSQIVELRGDVARVANIAGAGSQAMNKRFDSIDKRLKDIDKALAELVNRKE